MGPSYEKVIFIVLIYVYYCDGKISDKRLCADPTCSKPVSYAKTMIRYSSPERGLLSFAQDKDCTIYSKSAGFRKDLWGAEINGVRGYVPKGFVREYKIIEKELPYEVSTEDSYVDNVSVKNETYDVSSKANKADTNKKEVPNLEPDPGSGEQIVLSKTPSLDDSTPQNLQLSSFGLPSFSGSGVSAEPIDNESPPPNRDDIAKPFEVFDGTTVYYSANGEHIESKASVIQPTLTNSNSQPSISSEQPSKIDDVASTPTLHKVEPNIPDSIEKIREDSNEKKDDATETDEGSGGVLQYLSNWMPEGSGVTEEVKKGIEELVQTLSGGVSNKEFLQENEETENLVADASIFDNSQKDRKREPEDLETKISESIHKEENKNSLENEGNFIFHNGKEVNSKNVDKEPKKITEESSVTANEDEESEEDTEDGEDDEEEEDDYEEDEDELEDDNSVVSEVPIKIPLDISRKEVESMKASSNKEALPSENVTSEESEEINNISDVPIEVNITDSFMSEPDINDVISKDRSTENSNEKIETEEIVPQESSFPKHVTLLSAVPNSVTEDDEKINKVTEDVGIMNESNIFVNEIQDMKNLEDVKEEHKENHEETAIKAEDIDSSKIEMDLMTALPNDSLPVNEIARDTTEVNDKASLMMSDTTFENTVTEETTKVNDQEPLMVSDAAAETTVIEETAEVSDQVPSTVSDAAFENVVAEETAEVSDTVFETTGEVAVENSFADEVSDKVSVIENNGVVEVESTEVYENETKTSVNDISDNTNEVIADIYNEKNIKYDETYSETEEENKETVTETSTEVEYDVEVPPHDILTTDAPFTSEEEMSTVVKNEILQNEQEETDKESGGIFSGITESLSSTFFSLTSLFDSSAPDTVVIKDIFEDTPDVSTENTLHAANEEINKKRDAAWSSLWGGPSGEHLSNDLRSQHEHDNMEQSSSACNVGYDPSAGIDSDCKDVAGDLPTMSQKPEGVPSEPEDTMTVKFPENDKFTMDSSRSPYDMIIYLVITAVTVLLFTLGHYFLEKKRRDSTLVAKINDLEKKLLVSSKECLILKDELQATKDNLVTVESSSTNSNDLVSTLNNELEESKATKLELEEQVASLEKELEQATEAGLELNKMLQDFLTAQHGSETVMKSVEHLQKQLDSQQSTISTMTASLSAKNTENEALQVELNMAKERLNSSEEDLQKVHENLNDILSEKLKVQEELTEKNKLLQIKLDEVTEKKRAENEKLQKQADTLQDMVNELKDNLVTKESEVTVLQDCLKQLKNDEDEGEDKLQALLDVGHTKAELKIMTIERDSLAERLQGEEDARKLLEDHLNVINEEVTSIRISYEEAVKDKLDSETKLEVLSNYFKEKETQLQKELGLQEAMCLQKEGDATSTHERIKFLREEVENYKSQNETLKKEILDQERGLKSQLATLEKKAHENWVAARQAERKLEESKQEASQLRNRLTIVEKNVTNASKIDASNINDRLPGDSNGELLTSPVHMGITAMQDSSASPLHYQDGHTVSPPLPLIPVQSLPPSPFLGMPPPFLPPPPPGASFMPPPPPPLFSGDRRPPPLGRMSSPPPRYSPPPPDRRGTFSPYDHSPPPSPPPGRSYRSPLPHGNESPDRFRHHRSPPPPHYNPYSSSTSRPPPHWDDSHATSRSGFRPLPPPTYRDNPREPKGSALSSGHSSESLEKSSRHSGRV